MDERRVERLVNKTVDNAFDRAFTDKLVNRFIGIGRMTIPQVDSLVDMAKDKVKRELKAVVLTELGKLEASKAEKSL